MTISQERLDALRSMEEFAPVTQSELHKLIDAYEELARIKGSDLSQSIALKLEDVNEVFDKSRPLTTDDEDRIVARALREVARYGLRYIDAAGTHNAASPGGLRRRADALDGGEG